MAQGGENISGTLKAGRKEAKSRTGEGQKVSRFGGQQGKGGRRTLSSVTMEDDKIPQGGGKMEKGGKGKNPHRRREETD